MSTAQPILPMNWILGIRGTAKIKFLCDSLYKKILEARRSDGISVSTYMPWLSSPEHAQAMKVESIEVDSHRILTNSDRLKDLRRTYWRQRRSPLSGAAIQTGLMTIDVHFERRSSVQLTEGIRLVRTADPSWEARFCDLVKIVVPLKTLSPRARVDGVGFSTVLAKGAVFLSIPKTPTYVAEELSINVAHEMGHQALGIYQASDSILKDLKVPVYSAVRRTMRPGIHSFHAMVALAYMVDYLEMRTANPEHLSTDQISYFTRRLAELRAGLKIAVISFDSIALTTVGECIYRDCIALSKRNSVSV